MALSIELATAGRNLKESLALASDAEARGFKGAWVSEVNGMDGVALATALAQGMQRGRVGSAILPMQTRDPMLLAMASSTISQLTPDGFVLGLGTSTELIVQDWHATPWGTPLALTRECVALTRRFLAGERVTTEEGRWRYRRAQITEPANVPIYLAALNDRMLELAGEIADGVILNFVSVDDVRHARERIAAGAERAGKTIDDVELMVYFRASVTDDYAEAEARYQRELFTYVMAPVYQKMFARAGFGEVCVEAERLWRAGEREQAVASVPHSLIDERALIGDRERIASRFAEYEQVGVGAVMVTPIPIPDRDYMTDAAHIIHSLGNR